LVDAERLRRRLRELDRRLVLLEGLRGGRREDYLGDIALQAQVERHLQLALQAAIDLALHVSASRPGRAVEGYGDAFLSLAHIGVLPDELAGRLRRAAGLRNVLVHGYIDVDADLLWSSLDGLDDLRAFAAAMNLLLDGSEREK
jgi:uncharacterized protein YutE (UPF0331/DUF86 family)